MQTEKKAPRVIKRYGNRKLYDAKTSQYITLDGIRALVQGGEDVHVVDNETGEDLTRLTLAQILYEEERRKTGMLSLPVLRWLVERSDEAVRDFMQRVEKSREAWDNVVEATEKRVQEFVERSGDRSRTFFEELLSAPQRQLESLQHRIDQQVDRFTHSRPFQKEIRRIEEGIKALEKRLAALGLSQPRQGGEPAAAAAPPTAPPPKPRRTAAKKRKPSANHRRSR